MDKIEKQVRRAERRLGLQRFVAALGWTWTAALGAAAAAVLVDRFWPLGVPPWAWAAGGVVAGLLGAWIWTVARRHDPLEAAIEIDRRFGLRERVASASSLEESDRESPAGQALLVDAARRIERIDVASQMRVSPPRRLLYPLVPAAVILLLILFVSPAASRNTAQAALGAAKAQEQVKRAAKKLDERLTEQRQKAEKKGLKEAKEVIKLLQRDLRKLREQSDRKQALAKLNDLAKQLREKRNQSDRAEKVRNQLGQLKNIEQGPADRLAKAMKQGDFDKAAEELEKLRAQLGSEKLDEREREQLAKQMDQMADKLKKLADAHGQSQENLEQQIKKLRDAGELAEASKLEEQLAKLRQQLPEMDMLDKLAGRLKRCSECCKEGQMSDADEAMAELAENMGQLQQGMDELQMLDEAMDEVAECAGGMCEGENAGEAGQRQAMMAGHGLKAGKGHLPGGSRGEEPDAKFYDSQVRQRTGKGAMVVAGEADGPNRPGPAVESVKEQLEAARHAESDPMTDQPMPRRHREHAREYLDRFRQGE